MFFMPLSDAAAADVGFAASPRASFAAIFASPLSLRRFRHQADAASFHRHADFADFAAACRLSLSSLLLSCCFFAPRVFTRRVLLLIMPLFFADIFTAFAAPMPIFFRLPALPLMRRYAQRRFFRLRFRYFAAVTPILPVFAAL